MSVRVIATEETEKEGRELRHTEWECLDLAAPQTAETNLVTGDDLRLDLARATYFLPKARCSRHDSANAVSNTASTFCLPRALAQPQMIILEGFEGS
jgi:hypothetical protein